MHLWIKIFIVLFLIASVQTNAQLNSSTTMKKIDEIQNNTGTDILLNPDDKVDVQYFTGDKALISSANGELDESATTSTELGFVSGVTSAIQTQLNAKQDTLPLVTDGQLLYYNAGFAALNIGTAGQVLTVNGSLLPEWQDIIAVSVVNKGDLQTHDGVNPIALPVGVDGKILSANSSTTSGLQWIDPPATSPTTTLGDLIYRGNTEDERLAIGTQDQILSVNGAGIPAWIDPPSTSPTISAGDIIYNDGTGAGNDTFLSIGSEGDVLTVNSGLPAWGQVIGTSLISKGELQSHNGMENEAVPAPTANGQYLVSDDTQNTGMKWDDSILAQVGQAQFVGSVLYRQTGCVINATGTANTWLVPPLDSQCVNPTVEGGLSGNNRMQITIPNARTDGYYKVTRTGLLSANTNAGQCRLTLSSTTSYDNQGTTATDQVDAQFSNNISGSFKFDTGGNKTISLLYYASTSNVICSIYGSTNADLASKYIVEFFPDSSQLVAFQETELTAQTANEFSAKVSSTDVVSDENYDWIDGDCTNAGAGIATCNFISGVFSSAPNCVATPVNSTSQALVSPQATTSSVTVITQTSAGANTDSEFNLHCSRSTDVNKSQVVAGVFEQISTTELVRVRAKNLVGATSTTSFAYNYVNTITELEDNYNALNDTGDIVFTAPKDSYYNFDFGARLDGVTLNEIECGLTIVSSVTGASNPMIINDTNNASASQSYPKCFFSGIKLAEGDTVTFYVRKGGTSGFTWNTDSRLSYLKILEQPDTEAIVKNLNDNNNVECQTKFIPSTNITSTGVVSALTFNNLTVGKRYEIKGQYDCTRTTTTISSKRCEVQLRNSSTVNTNILISSFVRVDDVKEIIIQTPMNKIFTAQDTVVEFAVTGLSNAQIIGVTDDRTFLTLCEYPDNYIINSTKFN